MRRAHAPRTHARPRPPTSTRIHPYPPRYGVTSECSLDCELVEIPSPCALVSSTHRYQIEARDATTGALKGKRTLTLGELGQYEVAFDLSGSNGGGRIKLNVQKQPQENWGPLVTMLAVIFASVVAYIGFKRLRHDSHSPDGSEGAQSTTGGAGVGAGVGAGAADTETGNALHEALLVADQLPEGEMPKGAADVESAKIEPPKPKKSARLESLGVYNADSTLQG